MYFLKLYFPYIVGNRNIQNYHMVDIFMSKRTYRLNTAVLGKGSDNHSFFMLPQKKL